MSVRRDDLEGSGKTANTGRFCVGNPHGGADELRELRRHAERRGGGAATAQCYGTARAVTQREGRVLAPMDLLIGSHALSIDAVLVTNDHAFGQLPGLSIEDWTEGPG